MFDIEYQAFLERGGLDQAHRIVNEDWERQHRQLVYCEDNVPKASCPRCNGKRPLPPGMGGYIPNG